MCSFIKSTDMRDFEAIFVDDGSTDRTAALLESICKEEPRFVVLSQKNRGVSAARNTGLCRAEGEWVYFLDSDDVLTGECLEKLLSAATEETDLVIGMHAVFGDRDAKTVYPEGLWWRQRGEKRRNTAARRLIEGDSVLNIMCNKLHRRSFLQKNGIRLEEGLKVAEDALFNLQSVLAARAFAFLPEVTYNYRSHSESATRTAGKSEFEIHRPWLLAMGEWIAGHGYMPVYYKAYADSVVLRFYKDGGVPGVLSSWREKIRPVLMGPSFETRDLRGTNRVVFFLIRTGIYPYLYSFFVPLQIIERRIRYLAERKDRILLRKEKNVL